MMSALQGHFKLRDLFCSEFNQQMSDIEIETMNEVQDSPDVMWNRVAAAILDLAQKHFTDKDKVVNKTLQSWKNIF